MTKRGKARHFAAILVASLLMTGAASAATCGNDASGFERWKASFSQEAAARGVGQRALNALSQTTYARKTIAADRGQKSFKLSLDEFMQRRGSATIVSRGKALKKQHASLLANIERQYGVPAGPLLAIWGME